MAGEYAAHEGGERALFAVLEGRIEAVKLVDGIERVVGEREPGDVFGEVPIALGTVFPVGFRAAEPSRVMRVEARDYHAVAAAAPDLAKEVGRLAATAWAARAGCRASPPSRRRRARSSSGHRWDAACTELRRFLDRNQITFRWLTPDAPDAAEVWGGPLAGDDDLPAIRLVGGKTVVRPQLRRVAELLGLGTEPEHAGVRRRDRRRRPGRASPPRSTAPRRACARSSSSARRPAARPARRRGSRTTSASRPASRATSSRAARCSRRAGSAPRSS